VKRPEPRTEPVPEATSHRLSLLLRSLRSLEAAGVRTASSYEIAARFSLNSAQIRKDLAQFGEFGVRGVGYRVADLKAHLKDLMGLGVTHAIGIAGAGKLARPSMSLSVRAVVTMLTATEITKQVVNAMMAIQKFCAICDGNLWRWAIQPPLPSAVVEERVRTAPKVPRENPAKAPCAVARFQNMPSRKVANNGAFTQPNTSWSRSMMLLKRVHR